MEPPARAVRKSSGLTDELTIGLVQWHCELETVAQQAGFLQGSVADAAVLASRRLTRAAGMADLKAIQFEIEKRHDETVHRLHE